MSAVGTVLAMGAGCVLTTTTTSVEVPEPGRFEDAIRATVVARSTCQRVDLLLPPGGIATELAATVRFADGGKSRLEASRWQHARRGRNGWSRVRLHVPELLPGDRVELRVGRSISASHYDWTPGEDGARFAELEVARKPAPLADAFGVNAERGGYWVSEPKPGAAVRLWARPADREQDDAWALAHPSLNLPPRAPTRPDRVLSPAEATSTVSRFRLLPDRSDWTPAPPAPLQGVLSVSEAAALLAVTAELPLAAVLDPRRPTRPVGVVAYTPAEDGVPPRVWAHPDANWGKRWSILLSAGATSPVGAPAGEGPALQDPIRIERVVRLRLPSGTDPRDALVPGGGSRLQLADEVHFAADAPTGARVRLLSAPPGMRLSAPPQVFGTGRALSSTTGDQVLLLANSAATPRFLVTWERDDAPTCGRSAPEGVTQQIDAPDAEVRQDESGWWLSRWDDLSLNRDRERILAGLQARFNRRSLPEPGLPMRLRGRLRGWDLAAELVDTLADRARIAELPGASPLWPRRLHAARKSGVVTPFEAALIARIYALQAKIDADWVLVRSAAAPPAPELCAEGYDAMLVRLRFEGEERWLDPGCAACAPFEVRPALGGRPALGPGLLQTPAPPEGRFAVEVDGDRIGWSLEGPAALELRQWLQARPVEGRAKALAKRMAGPGATLVSVTGATERGVPIVAEARAARRAAIPDLAGILLPPPGELVTWAGVRSLRIGTEEPIAIEVPRGSWSDELDRSARETLGLQAFTER